MPELPEVQTIASDLNEIVGGAVIEAATVKSPGIVAGDPEALTRLVVGREIRSVERMGKWVRFNLGGAALLAHLKMTGQFHLGQWPATPSAWDRHDHAAFRLQGRPPEKDTLFYRDIRKFGRLRAFEAPELASFLAALNQGPDPLTVEPEEFYQRVTARRGRLKAVLLDQTTVAGLGNIYVDEGLFAARLSPLRLANRLSRAETDELLRQLQRLLTTSISLRGSTTSNYQGLKGGGSFQNFHQIYGRDSAPCPVCGGVIERSVVAGRGTRHCPRCQPPEDLR